jgi:DNA repair exonuclease SbcCD ATPase subunit
MKGFHATGGGGKARAKQGRWIADSNSLSQQQRANLSQLMGNKANVSQLIALKREQIRVDAAQTYAGVAPFRSPRCRRCDGLEKKTEELQRIINRGLHQQSDGMDLMRQMQQGHNDALHILQRRIASLETEIHEWERDHAELPATIKRFRQYETDIEELSNAYVDLENENKALADQVASLTAELGAKQEALSTQQSLSANLQMERDSLTRELARAQTEAQREYNARMLLSFHQPDQAAAVGNLLSSISLVRGRLCVCVSVCVSHMYMYCM